MSVLLHIVITVTIVITLGDYDRGAGPSQPEREENELVMKIKQESTCHVFVAEQLGRGFSIFWVKLDTDC